MTVWRNWAGDQTCTPRTVARPGSVDELGAVVRDSAARGDTVRVAGAGHSFGDLVCTDGTLVDLSGLTGLLDLDTGTGLARFAGGTPLHVVNALLAEQGRALPNLGDIDVQSVAGAISTATHGTGRGLGNLATQIDSLDVIGADGIERHLGGGAELRAARVSLGALGVISAVTLRTVPAFRLHAVDDTRPLDAVLSELDEWVESHDHVEFYAFPHSPTALRRTNDRTDEDARPRGRVAAHLDEVVLQNRALDLISRAGRRVPSQIPRLNRFVTRVAGGRDVVDESYRVFSARREVRFTETEWAVPRAACREVVTAVLAMVDRRGFAVNLPLEVRFVAADTESSLSPSWDRETCYVAAHMYTGMDWEPFMRAVQDIALAYDGRPHWGKRHFLDADALRVKYPRWTDFQSVRGRLDPDGVFTNDHVRRVLGAVSERSARRAS